MLPIRLLHLGYVCCQKQDTQIQEIPQIALESLKNDHFITQALLQLGIYNATQKKLHAPFPIVGNFLVLQVLLAMYVLRPFPG